ncbi:hypothetical protein BHQ18_08840 [Mycolicibacterium flavescens]|uniref:Uncharacterized protein n=1 Tax=Mycolicibacterium flavescens TaxID=1776 RepID=A0A1E3RM74_MYCFV|nr:hypothetical protein BHQ18_08840 [Mycolicibacterium flavescens]
MIVLVAGFVVFGGSGDSSGGNRTPVEAMRSYLEALAAGDAEKALSFAVNEPAEKSLLTDEILQKQLEKMPITDITVTETSGTGGVQVMATFGDIAIDETVYLKESADGGSWKLENAALPLDFRKDGGDESPALIDQITLFGEKMPASGRPYVFPGWVDIANSNPNVTTLIAPEEPVFLLDRLDYGENVNYGFETSEAGQEAVKKAIMALLVECAKSTELSPPNCPQNAASARVQGTARWTAPTDLDDLDFTGTIDNKGMQGVMGSVEFMVTLDATDPIFSRDNSPAPFWFEGKADMAQIPPTFTIRKTN